ncbi:type 2 isopentenyl-diphosphate Delta-isomerase [Chloroflexota bacterium]
MKKVTQTSSRKSDHIRINLEEDIASSLTTGLERFHFVHNALPEINLEDVDLSLELFGRKLNSPLLISSMTGGTLEAKEINLTLAAAAQSKRIALGIGSQRAAIERPELEKTFQVRKVAPDILLFANLGAIQLNYDYGVNHCLKAVDMIEADALILHLNALQEAVQPEGDVRWAGLLGKIEKVCASLPIPVIAKEVGWGFSGETARLLTQAGVAGIDVAGAGGTSWSQVEMHRAKTKSQARLASAFINWGIPTADSIKQVKAAAPTTTIIASGGLRTGIDVAKSIALGAALGGMAGPFLKAAVHSLEKTESTVEELNQEIKVCMFAAGLSNLTQLGTTTLIER